jgi:hypothetical protein
MRSPIARVVLLCAGLAGTPLAPLAAQQPPPSRQPADTSAAGMPMRDMMQMMGRMGMMAGCPLMPAMMRGPAAALQARDALHLSAAQVQRLQTAQRQIEQSHARAMDSMRVLHPRIAALADAPTLDERAARAAFERMGRLHADVAVAMLRAQREAAAVLTPQQRDSLAAIGRAHMAAMMGPGAAAAGGDPCAAMMQRMPMGHPGMMPPSPRRDSARGQVPRTDSSRRRP